VYELAAETIFKSIGKPKSELANSTITYVNLGSGLIAGAAAAIISQVRFLDFL
jgi:solute carrier family 25 phosphate transporter 3